MTDICDECEAVVRDLIKHLEWHDEQDRLLIALADQIKGGK